MFPPQSSGFSIQKPPRDIKGKRRALPEAPSDEDRSATSSSTPEQIVAAKGKATAPGPSRGDYDPAQTKDAQVNDEHEDPNKGELDPPDRHDHAGDDDEDGVKDRNTTSHDSSLGHLDESTAIAIFGDYRQLNSYMLGLSGRLKSLLNNFKPSADAATRLILLQELTKLSSISTEDLWPPITSPWFRACGPLFETASATLIKAWLDLLAYV